MALLSVHLKNGDTLHFGKAPDQTRAAYEALLGSDAEFVELQGYFETLPRFAIRRSEVAVLIYDPNDDSTIFASTALVRTAQYFATNQQATEGKTTDQPHAETSPK